MNEYAYRPNRFLCVVLLGAAFLFAQLSAAEHAYEHDPLELDSYCQTCLYANSTNDQLIGGENTTATKTRGGRSSIAFDSQVRSPKFRFAFAIARAPPS